MSLPEAVQLEKFCFWPVLDALGPDCTIVTLGKMFDANKHSLARSVNGIVIAPVVLRTAGLRLGRG